MEPVTIGNLAARLQPGDGRYVPVPPYTGEKLRVPHDRRWPLADMLLREGRFGSIVFAAPARWQLEPSFYISTQAHGIPLAAGHAHNMPLTLEMARQLAPSLLILSAEHVSGLNAALQRPGGSPPGVFAVAIEQAGSDGNFPRPALPFMRVIEVIPGYPVLYTCPGGKRTETVHLCDGYERLPDRDGHVVIGTVSDAPWTGDVILPYVATDEAPCACGKTSWSLAKKPYA